MQASSEPDRESRAAPRVEYHPLVVVPLFTLRQPLGALVRDARFWSAGAATVVVAARAEIQAIALSDVMVFMRGCMNDVPQESVILFSFFLLLSLLVLALRLGHDHL